MLEETSFAGREVRMYIIGNENIQKRLSKLTLLTDFIWGLVCFSF